jgi:hypothetical protein
MKIKLYSILFWGFSVGTFAQTGIVAAGVKATGSGGTVHFSVVPIIYKTTNGQPLTDGLQQPFEILTLTTDNFEPTLIELSFYPNPTTTNLHLVLKNPAYEDYFFQLTSLDGKTLIIPQKITNEDTVVSMESYPKGIYLLQVITNHKTLKTFKIIKR